MKNRILSCALLLLALAPFSYAQQNTWTNTTLASAVTTTSTTQILLTSATGVVANTTSIYINNELMSVTAVLNATSGLVRVARGQGGTRALTHGSGEVVWIGLNQLFQANPQLRTQSGTCVAANTLVQPYINTVTGLFASCQNGTWKVGVSGAAPFRVTSPDPGATAYTAINSAGTALSATTIYCMEVYVPTNKILTGIAVLNGVTVGTDKHAVSLYPINATGATPLAWSALAGATSSGASTYQTFAFVSGNMSNGQYLAVGGSSYLACVTSNGSTDQVRMATTGVNDNFLTLSQTGATFGTLPTITTAPTTFVTAVGPYLYLY